VTEFQSTFDMLRATVLSDTIRAAAVRGRSRWSRTSPADSREVKITLSALPNSKRRLLTYSLCVSI